MPCRQTTAHFCRISAAEYLFAIKEDRLSRRGKLHRPETNTTGRQPMEDAFLAAVKQAFYAANLGHDCKLKYRLQNQVVAALSVAQCIVEYESGNEYIRLDKLIDSFRSFCDIKLIEYRGRGSSEDIQLLFEFNFQGKPHQVIYILPQG
jgi:hypothetical protein